MTCASAVLSHVISRLLLSCDRISIKLQLTGKSRLISQFLTNSFLVTQPSEITLSNSRIKTITRCARYLHQTTYFCCKTTSRCQSSSVQNEDKTDLNFLLKRQNTQTSLHFLREKNKNKLVLLTIIAQWYLAV